MDVAPEDPPTRSFEYSNAALFRARHVLSGTHDHSVFVKEAVGCKITDVDGNTYIDYLGGDGAIIVGHADERVLSALSKAIGRGTSYGAPIEAETQLASAILAAFPAMEMLRFVTSRDDALSAAIRLARTATGKRIVLSSIPSLEESDTVNVPCNDLSAARSAFEAYSENVACIAVQPVATHSGVTPPAAGYLLGLRELCDRHNARLLFDESITGLRVAWGGAQTLYHVNPDLTILDGIIGGGLPLSAYAARRELIETHETIASNHQANPVAVAGGIATLDILKEPGAYETLEERAAMLATGLTSAAAENNVPVALNRVGSMLSLEFPDDPARFLRFRDAMLQNGILIPIDRSRPWFLSLAHSEEAVTRTLDAAHAAFKSLASAGS